MPPLSPAGPAEGTRLWWRRQGASPGPCAGCCRTFRACPCCRKAAGDRKDALMSPRALLVRSIPVKLNRTETQRSPSHTAFHTAPSPGTTSPLCCRTAASSEPRGPSTGEEECRDIKVCLNCASLQSLGSPTHLRRPTEGCGGVGQGNALLAQAEVCQDDVSL